MRYPSVHGTRHNGIALDWDANTFVHRLRSEGYRTGLVGKGHFQNFEFFPEIAKQQFDFSLDEQARRTGLPGVDGWDRYESVHGHLEEDIVVEAEKLECRNPGFSDMMNAVTAFVAASQRAG